MTERQFREIARTKERLEHLKKTISAVEDIHEVAIGHESYSSKTFEKAVCLRTHFPERGKLEDNGRDPSELEVIAIDFKKKILTALYAQYKREKDHFESL